MKIKFFVLLGWLAGCCSLMAEATIPGEVSFGGETYAKAWQDQNNNGLEWFKVAGYAPHGENGTGKWTKQITLFQHSWSSKSAKAYVTQLWKASNEQRGTEFVAQANANETEYYATFIGPMGNALELDFFHIFIKDGTLLSHQYSIRSYSGNMSELKAEKEQSERWFKELAELKKVN